MIRNIYIGLICLSILFYSCEKWLDINEDPNNPSDITLELALPSAISSVAYVVGGKYQVLGGLWSQHWTQSLGGSQYKGVDSYDMNSSSFDRQYQELYNGALKNFEYIKEEAVYQERWDYYLIATVMQCYTFQIFADLYDDIPFSEALKGETGELTPVFEPGDNIYDSLIARMDYALSLDYDNSDFEEIGEIDLLFYGDMEYWVRFANTLKLKIYLRQCYINDNLARAGIEELYSDEDIEFLDTYVAMLNFSNETGSRNPLYETEILFYGNNPNLVLSNTFKDYLEANGDPRLDALFNLPEGGGGHKGLDQGNYNDPEESAGTNSTSYSKPVFSPEYPVFLIMLSESYFLQAEAIARYGVKPYEDAKELYEDGVAASFALYGLDGESFYAPGGPYAFPEEGSSFEEEVLKFIIHQKWVALANFNSLETFFEHNRTHFPKETIDDSGGDVIATTEAVFTISVNNVTSNRFPKRLIYPESEESTNATNVPEKKPVYEKIWWDVKTDE